MDLLLAKSDLAAVLGGLMADHRVVAPVERHGALRFDALEDPDEAALRYRNTPSSPKSAFFPQVERMMRYARELDAYNAVDSVPRDTTPTVLFGVRPCDARGLLLLDRIFAEGPYLDPYYRARREATVVVSLACDRPRPTCFCHAFDSGPYDAQGADVLMRDAGDAYLLEGATERGAALLAGLGLARADDAHRAEAERVRLASKERLTDSVRVAGVEAALRGLFSHPTLWQEVSVTCLACGTCTYVCPTCHCFNIDDRVFPDGGERVRAWDSCMYPTFTLHASGHNPRPDQAARWRQRTMHKFEYLPRNVGMYGCVGCGRCIQSCPVRLDIRRVLDAVWVAAVEREEVTE